MNTPQAAQRLLDALAAAMPYAPHCGEFDRVADAADDLRAALKREEEAITLEPIERQRDDHDTPPATEPLALRLSEELSASAGPTHAEDLAFWACIVIYQVWAAAPVYGWRGWVMPLPWLLMAVAIRWPHWRRAWRNAGKSA